MARRALVASAMLATHCSAFNEVIELDMYRAANKRLLRQELSNDDMSDITGVLSYLHTQVVVEHVDADVEKHKGEVAEDRLARLNGIDTLAKVRVRVKNPANLLAGHFASQVDFGPAVQFVDGEATGSIYKWDYGDFVGAKQRIDARFDAESPYFWFALSGFCPNLPFGQKLNSNRTAPNDMCVWYKDGSKPLDGGLCINGTHPGVMPTGLPGCVYTYEPPSGNRLLNLDELVGITEEECAGRKCRDWLDFRSSCSSKAHKQKFQYSRRRRYNGPRTVATDVCVEYDIHPDCARDCKSPACLKVPEKYRELGLPFWRGRCDKEANRLRTEQLAAAFGIEGAADKHETVDRTVRENSRTCLNQYRTECQPAPDFGGMYCTRQWAAVCQACYIPGTRKPYAKASSTPYCPWNILEEKDYKELPTPVCATNAPRELCCIFAKSCNSSIPTEVAEAPADEDGYWLVHSKMSTEAMAAFLTRAVQELYGATVTDPEGLERFAYRQWGHAPTRGRSLAAAIRDMAPYIKYPPSTEPTQATTVTTTPVPVAVVIPTAAAPVRDASPVTSTGNSWWIWVLAAGAVVSLIVAGTLIFFYVSDSKSSSKAKSGAKLRPARQPATREAGVVEPLVSPSAQASVAVPMVQYAMPAGPGTVVMPQGYAQGYAQGYPLQAYPAAPGRAQ